MKKGRLDIGSMKTGKRQFRGVSSLLVERAATLPKASLIALWGKSTVALTRYLTFRKV